MPFSNLTIVSVTGAQAYAEGSMWAIARSCAELPGAKGLLISPERPANLPENIQHQPCKPFGYVEYSLFMIYSLAQFIHTDYCLVVQNDGWVLNGANWQKEFWDYDYIGAPILAGYECVKDARGQRHLRTHNVPFEHRYAESGIIFPQNGGFSLRSKRFLNAPRELGLAMNINPPALTDAAQPYQFQWGTIPVHSEDLFLTVAIREELQQAGIRFAPFDVANHFSFESLAAPTLSGVSHSAYLGHHFFKGIKIRDWHNVEIQFKAAEFNDHTLEVLKPMFQAFTERHYHVEVKLI